MNKYNNVCNNCNKIGHRFYNCKLPIISYGVILFRFNANNEPEYLMIRRKNSYGFIEIIQGKYCLNNLKQIQQSVDEMTLYEKSIIRSESFANLWKYMWNYPITYSGKIDDASSSKKFEILRKHGIKNKAIDGADEVISFEDVIDKSETNWEDTEWEFPKGRKNVMEKDIDCAIREFEEETGISRNNIQIVTNLLPFEEVYVGSNYKKYKTKFFLAYNISENYTFDNFQKTEVSKIEWKSIDNCIKSIRNYNVEKLNIISNIDSLIKKSFLVG